MSNVQDSTLENIGERSQIYYRDNKDMEFGFDDGFVALTFTSPPYFNYVEYEGGEGIGNMGETYEQYLEKLQYIFWLIHEKTMPGGRFVLNISNMSSRKNVEGVSFMYPLVADCTHRAIESGWKFYDEAVWSKMAGWKLFNNWGFCSGLTRIHQPLGWRMLYLNKF